MKLDMFHEKAGHYLEKGERELEAMVEAPEDLELLSQQQPLPTSRLAGLHSNLAPALAYMGGRLAILRPSFLPKNTANKPSKLRRTAYLDGVRGFAAFQVYILHHIVWAHAFQGATIKLENGFGWEGQYYFGALPFVRNFLTGGHFAVSVFFVLSGYVLSVKPLSLIHAGEMEKLGDALASSLFRRWLRLWLPIVAVTLIYACLPHILGIPFDFPLERRLRDEIWKWYTEIKNYTFVWDTGNRVFFPYQNHIWTIPIEFKGSITIYTALMAFSRARRNMRLWLEVALIFYFLYIADGAFFALFTGGMLLADLDILAMADALPRWMTALQAHKEKIFYSFFVLAMLIGGIPSNEVDVQHLRATPGWRHFAWLKPQAAFDYRWFFFFWGAMLLVSAVPHIPWLKRFYETRFCQYLGRISFMFYLLHGPILWTVGDRLYSAVGFVKPTHALMLPGWANCFAYFPMWGVFGLEVAFFVPQIILLPLTLWAAEISTALLDDQAIKFGQWLYNKILPER